MTFITSNRPWPAGTSYLKGQENSRTISLNLKPPTCTFSAEESKKFKEHLGLVVEFYENTLTLSNHILRKS